MVNLRNVTLTLLLCLFTTLHAQRPMGEVIEEGLSLSRSQSLVMAKELASQEGRFPRSFEKGKLITSDYRWWCSGFCALGLPSSDPFWANPYADWTSRKAWNNIEVPADHAIRN